MSLTITKSDEYTPQVNAFIDYLEMRMIEPSERGRLCNFVYLAIATLKLDLEETAIALGAYQSGGMVSDESLEEMEETITLIDTLRLYDQKAKEEEVEIERLKSELQARIDELDKELAKHRQG